MEYFLIVVAGIAIIFLIILLINNRRQGVKIQKSIREIKNLKTGARDYLNFFE